MLDQMQAEPSEGPQETPPRRPSLLDRLGGIELPHPLLIIFAVILLAAALTWIIPGGRYDRGTDAQGKSIVVAGSFHFVPHRPQGIFDLLLVPFNGMLEASEIIVLIFIISGAFAIIRESGALHAGIHRVTQRMKGREAWMIPILMIVFALGGGTIGLYEEVLPFVALIVPMAVAMGYDSIVGVAMVYLATTLGFCGAFMNPFTVGIAQGIANVPLFSGMEYRLVVWSVMLATGIIYTMRYAKWVKANPHLSPCFETDQVTRAKYLQQSEQEFQGLTGRQLLVLGVLAVGFVAIPVGVKAYAWKIPQLAGLFFALGMLSGILSGMGMNKTVENFVAGAAEMMNAAFLIGTARGVMLMLQNGLVMDTILYYLSATVSIFPKLVAVQIMFLVQCALNCFIQSGSAQAAVSMPIMAPLSDLLGISRQTAVLAFQMGDGFTNFAVPWNGITLAVLNIGAVSVWGWFRWAWKLQGWLLVVCMLLLVWPTLSNWQ